ncbi:MAG: hypothetical protein ACRD42_01690 [Nitrososphaeraceae archaeon]
MIASVTITPLVTRSIDDYKFDRMEHRQKYTLPFTPENVTKLWDMKNGKCSLTVKDELQGDVSPISVNEIETFKLPMDEIWETRRRAIAGDRISKG